MHGILDPHVLNALNVHDVIFKVLACDPALADTAAFCEAYGFAPEQCANTLVVASRKVEPVQYVACVVLATTRLDVNKQVCKLMDIKKASFADGETTKQLTGMMIGGVTAVGITTMPIYIDSRVLQQAEVVLGGGNRSSKILLAPQELLKLPGVRVVADLAQPKPAGPQSTS
jgi:prolyl-tRNA editing enzyme YbaK/EbsC (Cys-tRNA(Pro) deacylase)